MKNVNGKLKLLAYGLCLTAALYNCKPKDNESVDPIDYTFKGFDEVKLPEVKPSAPAPVATKEATITPSAQAAAVNTGLASVAQTGQVPTSVQQAVTDVKKAVPGDKAATLVASFTPDVINSLSNTGQMPANLKTEVAGLASNPALKAYLPTFSLPQVNGQAVTARTGAVEPLVMTAYGVTGVNDACREAAINAFNKVLEKLNADTKGQTDVINAAFNQMEATINAEAPNCKKAIPDKYKALREAAKKTLKDSEDNLKASRKVLGDETYNLLSALNYTTYAQSMSMYATLEAAETKACDQAKDARLAAVKAARDGDTAKINHNTRNAVAALEKVRDQAIASCHNQGAGK